MGHMNVVFIIAATNRRKLAYVGHAIAEISQFFVFLAKCKILPENFMGGVNFLTYCTGSAKKRATES